jgi:hypothetical protein
MYVDVKTETAHQDSALVVAYYAQDLWIDQVE